MRGHLYSEGYLFTGFYSSLYQLYEGKKLENDVNSAKEEEEKTPVLTVALDRVCVRV